MARHRKPTNADKRSRRTTRGLGVRLGQRIERLEERAMLSASMGGTPHGGGHIMPPQNVGDARLAEAAMFAPLQYAAGSEFSSLSGDRFNDRAFGGNVGLQMPPRAQRVEPGIIAYGGPAFQNAGYGIGSNYMPPVAQRQTTVVYVITIVRVEPVMAGDFWYESTATLSLPTGQVSSKPPSSSLKSAPLVSAPILAPNSSLAARAPKSGGAELTSQINVPNLGYVGSVPIVGSPASIPSAAQIISGQANSSGALPVGAIDAGPFSNAGRLLLAATAPANSGHILSNAANDVSASERDGLGEFIELGGVTTSQDAVAMADAVERERDAVDAVLGELHDLDSLSDEASHAAMDNLGAGDEIVDIELQLSPSDDALFGDDAFRHAEGGMVMLEARGDANDRVFDLIGAEADPPDLLRARAGVEAAVGFYQAVDVATEEVPTADVRAATSEAESVSNAREERRASPDSKDKSPNNAALGASATFLGALLWIGRHGRAGVKRAISKPSRRAKSL